MKSLNGIWLFSADTNPKVKAFGDITDKTEGKLRVTAQIEGRLFSAPLEISDEIEKLQNPEIDLDPALISGNKAIFALSTNAEYKKNGCASVVFCDAKLELYTQTGLTVIEPEHTKNQSRAIGRDYNSGEKTAELSFIIPETDGLYGAKLVPAIRVGAEACPEKRLLLVSFDGQEWFSAELDGFADGGLHDIAVSIPEDKLSAGDVSVIVSSNIDSPGNMNSSTLDLIHYTAGNTPGGSYISNSLSNWSGTEHDDRCLMISLRLKKADGSEDVFGCTGGDGQLSCVIGKFMGGAAYYHRQDFILP